MNNNNYVVMKKEKESGYWDKLSIKMSKEKAVWYKTASEKTYKGCELMIVQIMEEDYE